MPGECHNSAVAKGKLKGRSAKVGAFARSSRAATGCCWSSRTTANGCGRCPAGCPSRANSSPRPRGARCSRRPVSTRRSATSWPSRIVGSSSCSCSPPPVRAARSRRRTARSKRYRLGGSGTRSSPRCYGSSETTSASRTSPPRSIVRSPNWTAGWTSSRARAAWRRWLTGGWARGDFNPRNLLFRDDRLARHHRLRRLLRPDRLSLRGAVDRGRRCRQPADARHPGRGGPRYGLVARARH